ncbi:hypothetical protein P4129_05225 [Pseudomonas aeruginosa]|nr:hypothetical protein [Pseudomonas aeruginosa]
MRSCTSANCARSACRAFPRTIARGLVIDHWRREELQRA